MQQYLVKCSGGQIERKMKLERLVLKGGVHELDIYYRNILHNKREAILRCTDDDTHTINIDGEWDEEYSSATFHLSLDNIDKIIEKLQEAKKYLSGEPVEIEDGFGSVWSVVCPTCNNESMEVVRPGKVQCRKCQ